MSRVGRTNGRKSTRAAWRVLLPLGLCLFAVALLAAARRLELEAASPFPLARTVPFEPHRQIPGTPSTDLVEEPAVPMALEPGETVGQVLDRLGVAPRQAYEVISELARFADLRRLRPSDSFTAELDREALVGFELTLAGRGRARVTKRGDSWRGSWRPFVRSVEVGVARASLEDSLEASIRRAGAETMLAYLLSDVFQWDLDFTRDLRRGDEFEILFERVYLDGAYESLGDILAVRYSNRGRTLEAYRFGDPAGYYDGEGRPMRKMFLRSPLKFSRITSRFSRRRFHPVLKRYRPHYGVDYGAPVGTPVRATASGVVTSAGWDRGGGRTVKIRHPNGYLTAYLHLSRFASGIGAGRRVTQGQVIGYVGASGLVTAPHLDYRVQRSGSWINPLSLKSLPTAPLPDEKLPDFLTRRDALRQALRTGRLAAERPGQRVAETGPAVDANIASAR